MNTSGFALTHPDSASPRAKVISKPEQVAERLQELSPDLTLEVFRNAIESGIGARNTTTAASAVTAPGSQQWFRTVEVLRTRMQEKQWRIHDPQNCPFITSPDKSISIVVMTGNPDTGLDGELEPTNQADKGAVTEGYVHRNRALQLQQSFDWSRRGNDDDGTAVWVLLYHYDVLANDVRFELSQPIDFSGKKIIAWAERLIMERVPNTPDEFIIDHEPDNSSDSVIIEPRTGSF